jgi:hypothetical protein
MISRRSLAGSRGLRVAPRVLGDAVDKFEPVVDVELLMDVAGMVPDGPSGDFDILNDSQVSPNLFFQADSSYELGETWVGAKRVKPVVIFQI